MAVVFESAVNLRPAGTLTLPSRSIPDGVTVIGIGILRSLWPETATTLLVASVEASPNNVDWRPTLTMFVHGLPDYTEDNVLNTSYIKMFAMFPPGSLYVRAKVVLYQSLRVGVIVEAF